MAKTIIINKKVSRFQNYEFKFSIYKDMLRIDFFNHSFDSGDYGFTKLNSISRKKITSYSDFAAKRTTGALEAAGISTQQLKRIAEELRA